MLTVWNLVNCKTFSALALTENDTRVPDSGEFTISCDTANFQSMSYQLESTGDGTKVLRLWARDAAGNISKTPSTLTTILDTTPPTISIEQTAATIRGNADYELKFTAVDTNGINTYVFEYSLDGVNYNPANVIANNSSKATVKLPIENTTTANFRITVTDMVGNSSSAVSNAFAIDSVPPASPNVTLHSAAVTNSDSIELTITDCTDISRVIVNEAGAPTLSDQGWQTCSTTAGLVKYALKNPASGTQIVKVWSQDAAGNISETATNVSVIFDVLSPQISLSTPDRVYRGGEELEIAWSLTEENLASNADFQLSYYNGSSWTDLPSQNVGSDGPFNSMNFKYTWTVSNISTDAARVRVAVTDSAGNNVTATTGTFTIDSQGPVISKFEVNNGFTNASGSVLPVSIDVSDNLSTIAGYQLSVGGNFDHDAQWLVSPPSIYAFPFVSQTNTLHMRVKDGAGNISTAVSNPVTVVIGKPPTINIMDPDGSVQYTSEGQEVTIAWSVKLQSDATVRAKGINIYYTTDGGLSRSPWPNGSELDPGTNRGCILLAGQDGCVKLSIPLELVNTKFQILVSAEDTAGSTGIVISQRFNVTTRLKLFAGRNSNVMGGTALTTTLNYHGGLARDPVSGDIYLANRYQILKITASTGKMDHWAGSIGNQTVTGPTGDGQALSQARFIMTEVQNARGHIIVDSNRNVYWSATNGIWKYDFTTGLAQV